MDMSGQYGILAACKSGRSMFHIVYYSSEK